MKVHFYLPEQYIPTPDLARQWMDGSLSLLPAGGRIACSQGWIYQTWVHLRELADVELTSVMPESGIVIAMSNSLHTNFRPNDSQFVVAISADYEPHPGAHLQILQNRSAWLPHAVFMPHWPQPGLIPRDPSRGDRLETLAFFGAPENLAPDLVGAHWPGLTLRTPPVEEWHDFSAVDAVIGIRDFSRNRHLRKPPTKLYNAWLAGTIFLGGRDSAFRAERRTPLDYLEVHSLEDLTRELQNLQSDPARRRALFAQSQERGREFTPAANRQRWLDFVRSDLPRRVAKWQQTGSIGRAAFWAELNLALLIYRRFL